jgi:cytochrome c oxidase cbb3-type subunit III
MSRETDIQIKNHEYDGITEYDNPLPMWWLLTFFCTIIFGFLYYIHYTFTDAPSLKQEFVVAMKEVQALNKGTADSSSALAEIAKMIQDPKSQVSGRAVYESRCASCHADQGQGLVGPNLTDNYWIHGTGTTADLYKVVAEGVAEKGMPAWSNMIKPEEVNQVVAYISSLKGKNVASGKAPQGNKVGN